MPVGLLRRLLPDLGPKSGITDRAHRLPVLACMGRSREPAILLTRGIGLGPPLKPCRASSILREDQSDGVVDALDLPA